MSSLQGWNRFDKITKAPHQCGEPLHLLNQKFLFRYDQTLHAYLFHTKQYAKALQSLQKVSLSHLFYGLDVPSLTIKCYYELDEHEAFFNAYESFRVFVTRRKNVSEQHRRNYLNFLRIAKKLMNLRPRDKKNIENIRQEIRSQKALADKNWLEEKINFFAE